MPIKGMNLGATLDPDLLTSIPKNNTVLRNFTVDNEATHYPSEG